MDTSMVIYKTDTIVWFGTDFSFFRLSNEKKVGTEEIVAPYIPYWIEDYKLAIPNVKIASMLKIKKVIVDNDFTSVLFQDYLPERWIVRERHEVDLDEIRQHIAQYKTEKHGLGLVFIVENFFKGIPGPGDEVPSKVHGHFVWFNIDNREIIYSHTISGTPATAYFNDMFTAGAGYNGMGYRGGFTIGDKKNRPKDKGMEGYWLQGMIDATVAFTIEYKSALPEKKIQY
ncbi:MAG: hypothetical protein A3D92_04860 [Bacteroidetes bacterium RIFCSPHIGHO2_02_FULL_44_7]|nr:MAG: hypothetical protein A3D92_04860 [Bacteroidetes bacterium RIFCSPHIGHO2_02_FULL_44_7]